MPPRPQPRPVPPELVHHDVIHIPELKAIGWDSNAVRSLIRPGQAKPYGRGLLRTSTEPPTIAEKIVAASLVHGPPSRAGLLSAAIVLGWRDDWPGHKVDLVLPRGDTRVQRRPGVRLHSWDIKPEHLLGVHPLVWTNDARTDYDVLRLLPRNEAVATIDSALHLGLLSPKVLRAVGTQLPKTRQEWLQILDPRSESWLETIVRLVLADHGLHPVLQHEIFVGKKLIARLDLAFVAERVAIECDGRDHGLPEPLFRDRHRHDDVDDYGFKIIRVTTADILFNPADVVRRVRRALAKAA